MHLISKEFTVDFAHIVTTQMFNNPEKYNAKCKNLHGHTFTFIAEIKGDLNPDTRMVIDYSILKDFKKIIDNFFDHQLIVSYKNFYDVEDLAGTAFMLNLLAWKFNRFFEGVIYRYTADNDLSNEKYKELIEFINKVNYLLRTTNPKKISPDEFIEKLEKLDLKNTGELYKYYSYTKKKYLLEKIGTITVVTAESTTAEDLTTLLSVILKETIRKSKEYSPDQKLYCRVGVKETPKSYAVCNWIKV